jgi:hypothetical protein
MTNLSKADRALIQMLKHGSVTTHYLLSEIGMRNPYAQMKDLIIQGYPISNREVPSAIRPGVMQNDYSFHTYFTNGVERSKVPARVTKVDLIMLELIKGKKITTADLRERFGCVRPWDCMSSIIRKGYPVVSTLVESETNSDYVQREYRWAI